MKEDFNTRYKDKASPTIFGFIHMQHFTTYNHLP